jgi:gliding motility-associated-like protein
VGIPELAFEGDETAVVRIASAVNATVAFPDQVSVLLIEDNIPPSGFTVAFYDEVVTALNQTRIAFDIFGGEVDATYDFTISDGTNTVIGSGLITAATSQRISNIDLSALNEGMLTLSVTLTDPVGNVSVPQTDEIRKVPAAQVFPQGFSPNGDGVNDYWILPGIEAFPDNGVTIFNRYGTVVWEIKGYDNITKVFDGSSNANGVNSSAGLPDGTYFYVVTYGSPKQVQKGFIVIRR